MGLLNKITGFLRKNTIGKTQITVILTWISNMGGLKEVQARFRNEGLEDVIESWTGHGANLSVSADQITTIFGYPDIEKLATELGITIDTASTVIAAYLPKIIDTMSSDGNKE